MQLSVRLLAVLYIACISDCWSQETQKGFDFFPKSTYFEVILLDPNEDQVSAGAHKLWSHGGQNNSGFYLPTNIGFMQSFIRYARNEHSGFEIGMSAGVFAQFGIDKIEDNQVLAEMINTDYKATFFANYRIRAFDIRMRIFHISSHLSDDYIYRNNITEPNNGNRNYEQLDFTGSYHIRKWRFYGGLGMVLTPHAVREKFSSQFGFLFRSSKTAKPNFSPVAGMDVKIYAENNYQPDLRTGLGFEVGDPKKTHLAFIMEYYYGQMPYGSLDYGTIQWFGISTRLLPPRYR
jgi:hypothetical protein